MAGSLIGRVGLVTGAARMRGIGRAAALRLAREGAAVIVSAPRRDPSTYPTHEKSAGWAGAESVAAEIIAGGGRAIALECDVTRVAEVVDMIAEGEQRFGTPDAIVNNAGTAGEAGATPILDLDDIIWNRTIAINLTGTYNVCKAAGRAMRASEKPGAIVNLSSLAGRFGMANYGGYCASKFAVVGLSQQLAQELAPIGIRVNCLCPGTVDTDMMDSTFDRMADRSQHLDQAKIKAAVAAAVPLGRQGSPNEQAAMIAFLLGSDASYITGQTINVDGGIRMD